MANLWWGGKTKIKLLLLLVIAFPFFSCTISRLTKKDAKLQPYKQADSLVFEFNNGELFALKIEMVKKYTNPDDHLALTTNINQTLFVTTNNGDFLEIRANKRGKYIEFKPYINNLNYKAPNTVVELNKIKQANDSIISIKAIEYYDNLKEFEYDLNSFYWSAKYGYIQLKYKDGNNLRLKYFYRKGVNIYTPTNQ